MMQFTTIIKYSDSWASYRVMPGSDEYTATLNGCKGNIDSFPKFVKLNKSEVSNESYDSSSIEQKIARVIRLVQAEDDGIS